VFRIVFGTRVTKSKLDAEQNPSPASKYHSQPPICEDGTECSETSAFNIQTPGKYPEENLPYLQQGEILKTTKILPL
jgi:hypothetical protein